MALTSRDKWMLVIGAGLTLLITTSIGRRFMLGIMGMGKAEIERTIVKMEHKAEERAKPYS